MTKEQEFLTNPYKPGAGHMPPHLAGRSGETKEFERLLGQEVILENLVLTGLRGVGKTVLLDTFKPIAIQKDWLWVGTDLSESASISDENLAIRLLTDISIVTSNCKFSVGDKSKLGFSQKGADPVHEVLNFDALIEIFRSTPGLIADKLKMVLEVAWRCLSMNSHRGLIFAYDEAQNLSDKSDKDQFPLSLLLDTFQSLQKKGIKFMLVLSGLPTLFPKLVEARTFAERMFRVIFLDKLSPKDSKEAILKPIDDHRCPISFTPQSVQSIIDTSGGYPYFIQFICRESFDAFIQQRQLGTEEPSIPMVAIIRKLDSDFFAGRWARATDRERELLAVIAMLESCDSEFTVQEVVEESKKGAGKPFGASHVNQMLAKLIDEGLIFKNRYGKYSFAVPLLGQFIQRVMDLKKSPNL